MRASDETTYLVLGLSKELSFKVERSPGCNLHIPIHATGQADVGDSVYRSALTESASRRQRGTWSGAVQAHSFDHPLLNRHRSLPAVWWYRPVGGQELLVDQVLHRTRSLLLLCLLLLHHHLAIGGHGHVGGHGRRAIMMSIWAWSGSQQRAKEV